MEQPKMRILMMTTPVAPLGGGKTGGVTRHVINTALALQSRDHETTIFALKDYSPSFCKIQIISSTNATSSSDKICYELEPIK